MKCVIPGSNVRIFAKAIQSLSKVGNELYIEAEDNGLSIRTVNSTRSAFAKIKFLTSFFNDYNINPNTQDEFENKCKVSIKALLGNLKNIKQVELCKISIDSSNLKLILQLKCRLDTLKTHLISILELETLEAVYATDDVPNKVLAPFKIFSEISNNFQLNEEEITLDVTKNNLIAKNYVEGSNVNRKFMRSQFTLRAEEFDKFIIDTDTSITFCLREFRAFLNFAEAINLDMAVNFETTGRPVVFILNNLQTFEAILVMSTLSPDDISMSEESSSVTEYNISTSSNAPIKRKNDINKEIVKNNKKSKTDLNNTTQLDDDDDLFNFKKKSNNKSVDILKNKNNEDNNTLINLSSQVHENTQNSQNLLNPGAKTISNTPSADIYVTFKDTEDIVLDNIPKSPKSNKKKDLKRKIFRRCFEDTYNYPNPSGSNYILARNSDTED